MRLVDPFPKIADVVVETDNDGKIAFVIIDSVEHGPGADVVGRFHVEAVDVVVAVKNFVIVIGAAEKRFGLLVDSLVGEEELVIKALPGEIVSSDLVSGASILGDGTVVLILNVPAVLSRLSRATPLGAIA